MSKTIELSITGMTCDHCVKAVTNAAEDVAGVKAAKVSLEAKSAVIEGDDDFDVKLIIEAIAEEGYAATVR
jgi:copper chaperone